MKTEAGLTRNRIISELSKSPHGDFKEYLVVGHEAARQDPEFFAHLIAWNHVRGQIRDSKTALPIVSLSCADFPADFRENSLAHLAALPPRDLVRALKFGREIKTPNSGRAIRRMVESYLRAREDKWGWWEKSAVQHRSSMKSLYSQFHIRPANDKVRAILYGGNFGKNPDSARPKGQIELPAGSVASVIARLRKLTPQEAAGQIMARKIPFLIARGAVGPLVKELDVQLALIAAMTPTEAVNAAKTVERWGVKTVPALRAAYEVALGKISKSDKAVLKTTRAAEAMEEAGDETLAIKLHAAQERQLKRTIEGNWIVLADKSGSMGVAIATAVHVAAVLSRSVKEEIWLILFDITPQAINVTGKTLEQIQAEVKHVIARGSTSIGCGLQYVLDRELPCDGIALISDGCENQPPYFGHCYQKLAKREDRDIPVYWYKVKGEIDGMFQQHYGRPATAAEKASIDGQQEVEIRSFVDRCKASNLDMQQPFDLTGGVDYYSLPNLIQTMRAQRYGLADEIMETPLRTVDEVLGLKAVTAGV